MATKIRQSNITQPLDQDLSVPSLSSSGNISIADSAKIMIGGNDDLQLFHNTNHSYIDNYTGNLYFNNNTNDGTIQFATDDGTGGLTAYVLLNGSDGSVTLNYYGSQRLITSNTGVGITGNLTVSGDLTVSGNTVTLNTSTLDVEDINLTLASGAANNSVANGAGITIDGANAALTYDADDDGMVFNKNVGIGTQAGMGPDTPLTVVEYATATAIIPQIKLAVNTGNNTPGATGSSIDFVASGDMTAVGARIIGSRAAAGAHMDLRFHTQRDQFAMIIDPSQRVGIQTDNPGAALHVYSNTTTEPAMIIRNDNASAGGRGLLIQHDNGGEATDRYALNIITGYGVSDTQSLFVGGSGKVGIGTDEPTVPLDITTNVNTAGLRISLPSTSGFSANDGLKFQFHDPRSGGFVMSTIRTHYNGDGTHRLSLGSDTNEEELIVRDGNVGIGESTPLNPLHIYVDTANTQAFTTSTNGGAIFLESNSSPSSGGYGSAINFTRRDGSSHRRKAAIVSKQYGGDGEDIGLAFFTANGDTGTNSNVGEVLQLRGDGNAVFNNNVGIGIDGPSYPLEISSTSTVSLAWQRTGTGVTAKKWGFDSDNASTYLINITDNSRPVTFRNDGRVGINDELNPAYELDVAGDIQAQGSFRTEQVRHSIRPTLNLDFANSKELDPRITFYRNSMGSYYNASGILEFASHNEPRFDHDPVTGESRGLLMEREATNLYKNSILGKDWGPVNAILRLYNAKSPDGKMNAHTFIQDTSTGQHYLTMGGSYPVSNGQRYTWSFYAKAAGLSRISWTTGGGFAYSYARFELSGDGSNSLTNIPDDDWTITPVGNDWYRCTVTMTANASTNASFYLDYLTLNSSAGDGVSGVHIYGVQFEKNEFATSYIPSVNSFVVRSSKATYIDKDGTVKTAPRDTLRYSHKWDGRQYVETGPLFENSSTNLVDNSDFQSNWAFPNAGYSYATEVTAPDGTTIQAVSKNTTYQLIRQNNVWDNVNYTGPITVSYWAKAISSTGNEVVGHDLGDLPNSFTHSVTSDWVRYEHTHYVTAGSTVHSFVDFGLNSSTEVAIWGVQIEYQNYATSYIPSEVSSSQQSSSTRATDVVNKLEHTRDMDQGRIYDISDFFNTQEYKGTLYREISFNEHLKRSAAARAYTSFYNTAVGQDQIVLRVVTHPTEPYLDSTGYNISGTQWDLGGSTAVTGANQIQKQAVSFEDNNVTGAVNGASSSSDNDADVPLVTSLQILTGDTTACIKKIVYYPEALTNAQVVALTEND